MRLEPLALALCLFLVLSGCATPGGSQSRDPDKPLHTRDSRGAGTSSEMSYALLATNNTTVLHFAKAGMIRWGPDATEPRRDPIYGLNVPIQGTVSTYTPPVMYRHVSTNNGTITKAWGQFWFEVRDTTPAANGLLVGGPCTFGIVMSVQSTPSPGARVGSTRSVTFCSTSQGAVPALVPPGLHSLNLTASMTSGLTVKIGDLVSFRATTNLLSTPQRSTTFFWYGARAHDSVVHFEGWEEPAKKAEP